MKRPVAREQYSVDLRTKVIRKIASKLALPDSPEVCIWWGVGSNIEY